MKITQLLLSILLAGGACWIAPGPSSALATSASGSELPALDPVAALQLDVSRWAPRYNWALQNWSVDNKPYRNERTEIDLSIRSGADPVVLVKKYETSAVSHPFDPKAVFAFAYAYYKAQLLEPKRTDTLTFKSAQNPDYLLENAASLYAFDYARLQFLESVTGDHNPQMIVAGYRLYIHNPADTEVELALAKIVDVYRPGPLRRFGLYLARDLVMKDPQSTTYRSLLSDDYFTIWEYSHSQADAAKAMTAEMERLAIAHATPAQIAGDLQIDQIKHYVRGQSYFTLSPLTLEWYKRRVAKYPEDWGSWLQISTHFYELWRNTRSSSDASACIDAYQHALDAGPKDDRYQSTIRAVIAEVRSGVPRVYKNESRENQ